MTTLVPHIKVRMIPGHAAYAYVLVRVPRPGVLHYLTPFDTFSHDLDDAKIHQPKDLLRCMDDSLVPMPVELTEIEIADECDNPAYDDARSILAECREEMS